MTDGAETSTGAEKPLPRDKKAERAERLEKRRVRTEEIAQKVEDPNIPETEKDKQAALLFTGLQESFKKAREEPNDNLLGLDSTVGSYRAAYRAVEKMDDDPAEVVKALSALREFNNQLGLSEYSVDLGVADEELKNLQEKDKQKAMKKRIREDVEKMPQMYAHNEMLPVYNMMARKEEFQGEVASLLPESEQAGEDGDKKEKKRKIYEKGFDLADLPSRSKVRFDAFEVQKAQNRIDYTTDWLIEQTGDEELAEAVVKARQERSEEKSTFKPWNKRTEEERETQVKARHESFRDQVRDGWGQKSLDAFDSLSEEKQKSLVTNLIQNEVEAENAYNNVEKSLDTGDAGKISDRLSQAKEAQLGVKDNLAQIQITLASQRAENSSQALAEAARNFSRNKGSFGDVVRFGTEALSDKVGALVEPFKQRVLRAAEQAKGYAEEASERFAEEVTKASDAIHSTVIKDGDLALQDMRQGVNDLREKMKSVKPGLQRNRLSARSRFFRTVGNIARGADRAIYKVAFEVEMAKRSLGSAVKESVPQVVEKVFGVEVLEEEDKAKFEKARDPERIRRRRERINKLINERVEKKHEGSPGDKYFWDEAMKYVKQNIEPVEEPKPEVELKDKTESKGKTPENKNKDEDGSGVPVNPPWARETEEEQVEEEQPESSGKKEPAENEDGEDEKNKKEEKDKEDGEDKKLPESDVTPELTRLKSALETAQVAEAAALAEYERSRKGGIILSAIEIFDRNAAEDKWKKASEKVGEIQVQINSLVDKRSKKKTKT